MSHASSETLRGFPASLALHVAILGAAFALTLNRSVPLPARSVLQLTLVTIDTRLVSSTPTNSSTFTIPTLPKPRATPPSADPADTLSAQIIATIPAPNRPAAPRPHSPSSPISPRPTHPISPAPIAQPPASGNELGPPNFVSQLRADLQSTFAALFPHPSELSARVEFSVRADGTLSGASIVEPSGSPEFDAAVLAACVRVRAHDLQRGDVGPVYSLIFSAKVAD